MPSYGSYFDPSRPLTTHPLNVGLWAALRCSKQWRSNVTFRDLRRVFDTPIIASPTLQGTVYRGEDGSLGFDGATQYAKFTPFWPGFPLYTVMIRFRLLATGNNNRLLTADDGTLRSFQYRITGGNNLQAILFTTGSAGVPTGATSLVFSTDYISHYVVDPFNAILYLNGVQDGISSYSGVASPDNPVLTLASGFSNTPSSFLNCQISLCKIWQRPLSPGEVMESCVDEWKGCPDTINWLTAPIWSFPPAAAPTTTTTTTTTSTTTTLVTSTDLVLMTSEAYSIPGFTSEGFGIPMSTKELAGVPAFTSESFEV